jgi:hypothetical protein
MKEDNILKSSREQMKANRAAVNTWLNTEKEKDDRTEISETERPTFGYIAYPLTDINPDQENTVHSDLGNTT